MSILLITIMVLALLAIPLGLPGLWIMLGVVLFGAFFLHQIGLTVVIISVILALVAEFIEFAIVKKLTKQYGGSRKAFWGAIGGGLLGVIVGVPVPIIGSVIAGMVGSFAGAAIVTLAETRQLGNAQRVGWGAVMGRALSAVTKTAAGLTILVITAAALLHS